MLVIPCRIKCWGCLNNWVLISDEKSKQAAGTASALLGLLQFISGALVAPLVGIGSNTALPMGVVIALCEVGAVLCYLFMARRSEKQFELQQRQNLEELIKELIQIIFESVLFISLK